MKRYEISNENIHTREARKAHKRFMMKHYLDWFVFRPIGFLLFGAALYLLAYTYYLIKNTWVV